MKDPCMESKRASLEWSPRSSPLQQGNVCLQLVYVMERDFVSRSSRSSNLYMLIHFYSHYWVHITLRPFEAQTNIFCIHIMYLQILRETMPSGGWHKWKALHTLGHNLSSYVNPILGYKAIAMGYIGHHYDNHKVMLAPNYNATQSHVKIILILKFCTNR